MFKGTLTKPATCNGGDGISHAAIDLHVNDQMFVLDWIVYAEEPAAKHCHTHAQDLAWADATAVHCCRISK